MEESQYPTSLNPKMALSSLNFSSQPTPPAPSTQKRRQPLPSTSSDDVYSTPRLASKRSLAAPPAEPSQHVSELLEEEACQQLLQLEQVVSRTTELSEANDSVPARLKVLPTLSKFTINYNLTSFLHRQITLTLLVSTFPPPKQSLQKRPILNLSPSLGIFRRLSITIRTRALPSHPSQRIGSYSLR